MSDLPQGPGPVAILGVKERFKTGLGAEVLCIFPDW